jgi:hypothetical protein
LRVYYGLDFSLWQVEQAEVSGTAIDFTIHTLEKVSFWKSQTFGKSLETFGSQIFFFRVVKPILNLSLQKKAVTDSTEEQKEAPPSLL